MILAYAVTLLFGFLTFLAIYFSPTTIRGAPLVSCYTTILLLLALYFFLPAIALLILRDGEYVWARGFGVADIAITSFVCVLALATFVLGYAYSARFRTRRATVSIPNPQFRNDPVVVAWIMIAVGVAAKFYLMFLAGGLEESILRLSAGVRRSLQMEDDLGTMNTAIIFLSSIADAAITWLVIRDMYRKRFNPLYIAVFFAIIGMSFLGTGKRLYILWPLICGVMGYHFYVRPLSVKLLPLAVLAILLIGFGSLLARVFLPASYAGAEIDLNRVPWAEGSLLKFYLFSLEFATYEILTYDLYNSDVLISMFGGGVETFYRTNIEPLTFLIPREVWPSKPEVMVDLAHANRAAIIGGSLEAGGGINSTVLGTAWTFGGGVGLAIAMIGLGVLASLADRQPSICGTPEPARIVLYAFWIVVCFHFFRQGTIGWTVIITLFQQLGALIAFITLSAIDPLERGRRQVPLQDDKTRLRRGRRRAGRPSPTVAAGRNR